MSFKNDDIPMSDDIKVVDYKPNQKLLKILVEATTKAKNGEYEVVNVKGQFSGEEYKTMKFYMKNKGYEMWKSESGYSFTPSKNLNTFENTFEKFGITKKNQGGGPQCRSAFGQRGGFNFIGGESNNKFNPWDDNHNDKILNFFKK